MGNGFVQIDGDKISVLAESAINEEKIDGDAAEKAMKRAQELLATRESMEPAEVERLEGIVRSSIAQLLVKRRRR